MSKSLSDLIEHIQLEQIEINLFRGEVLHKVNQRIYGGEVLAQAMNAAHHTVATPFVLHSVHAYFLRPGDPGIPVVYDVDRIRDGRSFVTRRVVAIQRGRAIFNMSLSFQLAEASFEHQSEMPDCLGPDQVPSDAIRYQHVLPEQDRAKYNWPVEFRQVDPMSLEEPTKMPPRALVWMKADGQLADDLAQHQELLAYASDNPILTTALRPHGLTQFDPSIQIATLDHAIWFHRPFRIDEWLLYELDSFNASGGRGFVSGKIFNQAGQLVASATQEGLVRYAKKEQQKH